MIAKESIILWANYLGFKHIRYKDELDRAANIGTVVHGMLEQMNTPKVLAELDFSKVPIYAYQDREAVSNAIYSFYQWYRENRKFYHPVFTEKTIIGKKVGGTIDVGLRGLKDPNKIIIGDYKTSSDIYFTHVLQLASYVSLYEEECGSDTVEGIVLFHLDKREGYKAATTFIFREDLNIFMEAFDNLLQASNAINGLQRVWKDFTVTLEGVDNDFYNS